MTAVAISALIVAIAVAWIAIDDRIWGRKRRVEILERLLQGPILRRDLACGRSCRYVLLGNMQDEGLLEVEDLGCEGEPYRYRITELGRAWLCVHRAGKTLA